MKERDSQLESAYRTTKQGLDQSLELIETLQRDLDRMREELARADRLNTLGTLAATLAHEFNNLMMPIGIYAQLALADPGNSQKAQKAIEAAANGVARVSKLADATLSLAAPARPDQEEQASLAEAVDQAITCIGPKLKQNNVTVNCRDIIDAQLAISPLSLQQVLVNLLSNANRALEGTSDNASITLSTQKQDNGLAILVQDNGPGVPGGIRDQLFDAYISKPAIETSHSNQCNGECWNCQCQDEDRATQEAHHGTGLGLHICKTLAESAGGWIALAEQEDREQQGATFELWLPFAASK